MAKAQGCRQGPADRILAYYYFEGKKKGMKIIIWRNPVVRNILNDRAFRGPFADTNDCEM